MDYYFGEIRQFAADWVPVDWALCDGQLLSISSNANLFAVLGNRYGGDGLTTFALPDFRGRIPVGAGQAPGLSSYALAQKGGSETITVQTDNLPVHSHTANITMNSYSGTGNTDTPINAYPARVAGKNMYAPYSYGGSIASQTTGLGITTTGGSSNSVNLVQPVMGLTFIICINGDFPSRT
jgi:microcystin-dependent protein